MAYSVVLENISLDAYQKTLKSADLLPSRKILQERLAANFSAIKKQQIDTVAELRKALSSKVKLQDLARQSGVAEEYLQKLRAEVNSLKRKPNKLRDFPDTPDEVVTALEQHGIKNTRQLFDKVLTSTQRSELAKQTGVGKKDILRLAKLTDLSRIRWVGHTFAFVLYELGYDTVEKVAAADYKVLYEAVKQLNEERQLYKGHIGLHDMKLTVEAAKDVSNDIEY